METDTLQHRGSDAVQDRTLLTMFTTTFTVLVDNWVSRSGLMGEHGLACWIDMGMHCILFDTGQTSLLAHNAGALKIDLDAVDTIVLSHGHYDHSGGLAGVLARAAGAVAIHLHPAAVQPKYHGGGDPCREIGIPAHSLAALQARGASIHPVTVPTEIAPGLFLTGEIPRIHPEEAGESAFCLDKAGQIMDPLLDDQALFLRTKAGTVVLLGCAHAGVINTLDHIRQLTDGQPFHTVLGGMHLHAVSDQRLAWTLASLKRFNIGNLYPVHCTGTRAVAALWAAFPGRCFPCGAGTTLHL